MTSLLAPDGFGNVNTRRCRVWRATAMVHGHAGGHVLAGDEPDERRRLGGAVRGAGA